MIGKSFKITDPDARIRDDRFQPVLNPDTSFRLIPQGTIVTVEEYNINGLQQIDYVKVRDFGWTARSNFEFGLANEIVRTILPGYYSHEPIHFTVIDENARIRKKSGKEYPVVKGDIPVGTLLVVKQFSPDKTYLQTAYTLKVNNGFEEDTARKPVWTKTANLSPGWFDPYGVNGLWKKGVFLGLKPIYAVVGGNGTLQNVLVDTYEFYLNMVESARKDGIGLELTSGFRTWGKQYELYQLYIKKKGNPAAKPGRSNHQNGIAFDLNTGRKPTGAVYNWLHAHAAEHGFIRTVGNEPWHWEYQPDKAKSPKLIHADPDSAGMGNKMN